MKRLFHTLTVFCAAGLLAALTACAGQAVSPETLPETSAETAGQAASSETSAEGSGEQETQSGEQKILIAYFTRLDNTAADVDAIIQGGGPYGSLGNSLEEADMDAVSSASITQIDGEVQGNVEAMARMIAEKTGGDLFSIQTAQNYPLNYDELIELGGEEKNQQARPELSTHVENMEDYDVIFLGYPNWWYDMPMAVYSFLEEYDLSGKTIIPFAASAGSGFSGTIASIQEIQPDAAVVEDGLHIPMGEVAEGQEQINAWIDELGI